MKIQIVKSNSADPVWAEKYIGRKFEVEFVKVDIGKSYYRLKDGSCWFSEEIEICGEEENCKELEL